MMKPEPDSKPAATTALNTALEKLAAQKTSDQCAVFEEKLRALLTATYVGKAAGKMQFHTVKLHDAAGRELPMEKVVRVLAQDAYTILYPLTLESEIERVLAIAGSLPSAPSPHEP